jgi:Asp/Glu/hydantoin racemase
MKDVSAPIRVWYQSFVDPDGQADYFRYLKETLASTGDPGVRYEVQGISPPDLELHRITEFRCAAQVLHNAVAAQRQGYDALAIGHFQDSGLYEARATVDIPVLSLGEASMLFACTLGQKIALVTINPVFIPMHEEQVLRYGLRERITAIRAITTNPTELVQAFTDATVFEQVLRQFREQVQPLVADGVEVIIPAGGLPALLFSRLKSFTVGGVVVLNCIAVLAKMTEMAVALHRLNGTGVSRAGTFVKPSARALQEFLGD